MSLQDIPDSGPAPAGHNSGATSAELLKLLERKDEYLRAGSKWLKLGAKLENQQDADDLAGFARQVAQLRKDAEALFKIEKAPHEAAIAALKEAFGPIGRAIELITGRAKPLQTDWLTRKQAAIDAEAERQRKEAEAERQRITALQDRTDPNDLEAMADAQEKAIAAEKAEEIAERLAKARARSGGQYVVGGTKRSAYLGVVWSTEIVDSKKAAARLHKEPEVLEALQKAAARLQRSNRELVLPGVKFTSKQEAR